MEIQILGVPMDLGQERRGVDMGPSALRYAGLEKELVALGHEIVDTGNLFVPIPEMAEAAVGPRRMHAVADVCSRLYEAGRNVLTQGGLPLYLGGDHSISIGTVKAAAADSPKTTGVIWIDAHADFNIPETSPSGNIHGMPVAVLTGDGEEKLLQVGEGITLPIANVVQIGVRDVDPGERRRISESGLRVFSMRSIDTNGMARVAAQTLDLLSHCERIHISLDLDSLDPSFAPGVGTPVRGGLSYREAHLLAEILSDCGKICSVDIVEVNPILDDQNKTAELAVELVASLFGKQILSRGINN